VKVSDGIKIVTCIRADANQTGFIVLP